MSAPAATRPPLRLGISLALGLVLSAVLLWLLLRRVDLARVIAEAAAARWSLLVLWLPIKLAAFVGLAWRLHALLAPVARISGRAALEGQLVGFAANNVIPLRLGELVRADFVARKSGCSRSAALAVATAERLLDVLCILILFVFVSPLVLPRLGHREVILAAAAALLLGGLTAWGAARWPQAVVGVASRLEALLRLRAGGRLSSIAGAFAAGLGGLRSPRILLAALAGTGLYWASAAAGIQVWLRAFSVEAPWFAPAVVLVFVAFGTALPASPGFIGTYDYFFVAALGVFAVEPSTAASVALVGHTLAVVPFTLLGLFLVPGSVRALSESLRSALARSRDRAPTQV